MTQRETIIDTELKINVHNIGNMKLSVVVNKFISGTLEFTIKTDVPYKPGTIGVPHPFYTIDDDEDEDDEEFGEISNIVPDNEFIRTLLNEIIKPDNKLWYGTTGPETTRARLIAALTTFWE